MSKKTKKSISSVIKSHGRSIKDKSRLLVEAILAKDPLSANKIFPGLVKETEDLRELEVKKLILEDDDDDWGDDDTGDEGDDEEDTDDEGEDTDDEGEDDEDSEDSEQEDADQEDTDTNKIVDDAIEIQCQINAKVIENLFDVIADLKNTLNNKNLDETSKEFITLDTTISYYSDKLQELQTETNPGTDQTKLEEKLDKITKALEELKTKAGDEGGDDDVDSPDELSDSEEGETEDSDQQSDEDYDEDQEQQEDEDQEQEQQEDQEQQSDDEDF